MRADVEDSFLVVRAREGYLDAFEMLTDRYGSVAYRVALRLVDDHHEARNIAREALLTVWRELAHFKAGSSFSTWIYQIVIQAALTRPTPKHRPGSSQGPIRHGIDGVSALPTDTIPAAVAALPPDQRIAVVLHHFEGLSYAEVASITAATVPAVRSQLFQARRTLAATLGQWR